MKPARWLALVVVLLVPVLYFWPRTATRWPVTNDPPESGTAIIAFGDSLTAGYGLPSEDSYPSQLSTILGKEIINAGIPGETTADALRRIDHDVLDRDPRIVLVCLGGNDMLRKMPIATQFTNLRRIVTQIQQKGALVILIGIEGNILYPGDYDREYQRLAEETGCVYIPNFLKSIIGHHDLMHDSIHPNGKGYAVFVERLMDEAGEYLEK